MSFLELFRKIYYTSLFKNLIYYCSYWLLILFFHHILVSGAAFFHFQLSHKLGTIEEWIFDRGWQFIIIAKFISAWLILKFVSIKSDSRSPLREIFTRGFIFPEREILVFTIFFVLICVVVGGPTKSNHVTFYLLKPFISFWSIIFFFLTDILVFNSLKAIHPFSIFEKWASYVLFSAVLYLSSRGIFLYGLDVSFNLYLIAFLSFYFSDWRQSNWSIPGFFLATCVAPLSALVGWDPIWKGSYAPLVFSRPLHSANLSVIVVVALGYFFYKSRQISNTL